MSTLTRAAWDTAYINDLPDSCFLYVEAGGKKDSEGKTTPRSLRHFPVKDAQGNVDGPHLRNALSRIPQSNLPASVKEQATAKARRMLEMMNGRSDESPPRDDLVRTAPTIELVRSENSDMPVLHGTAAVFNEWTEIRSSVEGHFFERFVPGSFAKTIKESGARIRCLFHHGQDPSVGAKVLGPITALREEQDALHYEVQLLDTDYNRSLIPGLQAGLYGSSFRFGIVRKDDDRAPKRSDRNPRGILERTISEAYLRELGPTPLPAYAGTSAGIRSLTDEFLLGRFPTEELLKRLLGKDAPTRADIEAVSLLTQMYQWGQAYIGRENEQPDPDPQDVSRMTTILQGISELIAAEAAEDEPAETEPSMVGDMMNSVRDGGYADDQEDRDEDTVPAPSSDAALVGTSGRSAATTPALYGSKEDKPKWLL